MHGDFVRKLIQNGHVSACHDISDGGLLTAVAEMAIASASSSQTLGVKLKNPTDIPDHAFFFGEEQSRYILSTNNSEIILREAKKYNVKTEILGKTSVDKELTIDKIVYAALKGRMGTELHALALQTSPPSNNP